MNQTLRTEPLSSSSFAPFGEVIEAAGQPDRMINGGRCARFHDRAHLDFGPGGRAGISVFRAEPRSLPMPLEMVERHPDGSQSFLPMSAHPWLVVVAPDSAGVPGRPRAFIARAGQGVSYRRGTWHGVLSPLHAPGLFAVVDRIGDTPNLQEYWFDQPWEVRL